MSTNIQDLIVLKLHDAEGGLTAEEIYDLLDEEGVDRSERTVKAVLKEMAENGELARERVPDGPGRPPYRYFLASGNGESMSSDEDEHDGTPAEAIPNGSLLTEANDVVPRSVIVRGNAPAIQEEDGLPDGVYWDVVERQLESSRVVQDLQGMAPKLAEEDPVGLLVEMLEWTVDLLNHLGERLVALQKSGKSGEVRFQRDLYKDFAYWARQYFHQFWRLNRFDDPGPDVLRLPEAEEFIKTADRDQEPPEAEVDIATARDHLQSRVFGDQVISTVDISQDTEDVVGTDSSVATVSLPGPDRGAPETEFKLFAGAAALQQEARRYTDYDFNPRDLKEYQHRKAYRKGLMLSKQVLPQLGEGEAEKSKYASMDLRQYRECVRVVEEEIEWEPHGDTHDETAESTGPDVMFLDGRVTPLVHQHSDFVSTRIYGELVRREVKWFKRLADLADEDNWDTDTTFAGVVKQPAISWLAPLVFWYLEVHYRENGGFNDEEDGYSGILRNIHDPPISDVVLPHFLFQGLANEYGPPADDEIYSTFRALRRFYDHSLPDYEFPPQDGDGDLIDVDDREEWMDVFEKIQEHRENRGRETIDLDKYRHFGFAEVCANVSTVMCYAGPSNLYGEGRRPDMRLPRIEILAAPPQDNEAAMREALAAYGQHNKDDADHSIEGFSQIEDVAVVVPTVIDFSDEIAKGRSDAISDRLESDIQNLAAFLRRRN